VTFNDFMKRKVVLDDMILMPNVLKVLGGSLQTQEVVLLERNGRRLRLQSPSPIAPGSAVQLKLEEELLLGEIIASTPRGGDFEIGIEAQEVLHDSWRPDSEWSALDSEESVIGSLVTLNACLLLHEKMWRVHCNGCTPSFGNHVKPGHINSIS